MSSQKLTLVYFPIHGRALPIRLAFAVANIPYEIEIVTFADWPTQKATTWGGVIPVLRVGDNVLGQSNAILNYVCNLGSLLPVDPLQRAQSDEALAVVEDYIGFISPTMRENDPVKKKAMRIDIAENKLPPALSHLDEFIANNGANGHAVGSTLSPADFKIFQLIWLLKSGMLDDIPTSIVDVYPQLILLHQTIAAIPAVKLHLESFGK